jgi:sporulation protein YlmC with PRC-barrel domain
MAGREYYLTLHLLDRQLVDRQGRLVGNVDDLELEPGASGELFVTAILSGPGMLARRMRFPRYGDWLAAVHRRFHGTEADGDPSRITFRRVARIGNHIDLAAEKEELATHSSERWVADHVISHIPGNSHAAE